MDTSQGSRKAVLLVFVVFALGIALGSLGTYVVSTRVLAARPQAVHRPGNAMAMFTKDLNLSPDQQKQIEAILSDTRARYGEIHKRDDPDYENARNEGRERIRKILTPDQGPKFEELLLRMDAERRRREAEEHGR
jgi:Spy/CpxP family protein refolding chaperone